jgi:NADH dehydrogenase
MTEKSSDKHKILIVGGGAAGLELATTLGQKLGKKGLADVTLLDGSTTHVWKPLLHEIAAGTLDESEQIDYMAQGYRNHFIFRLGNMKGLNREKKEIYTEPVLDDDGEELVPSRCFSYDTLVLSVGSISNTYNTPGVKEHCLFLDSTKQAFRFQKHFLALYFKRFVNKQDSRHEEFSIVIIGAGATGVELAAQLYEVTQLIAVYDLKLAGKVKITMIEGSKILLPALPRKLAEETQQQLVGLGVELKLGRHAVEVSSDSVKTEVGEIIPADMVVWSAGIKASDWLKDLDGLETNHLNQLLVDSTLKTADDNIFALGDCAACVWVGHDGNVPPRAQAAHQQATVLGKSLINRMKGDQLVEFSYYDYGSLVALGKYSTVGSLMGNLMGSVSIAGFIAKLVYVSLYKMHQVAIHGYFRTTMLTLSNIFRRSAFSKIKMH